MLILVFHHVVMIFTGSHENIGDYQKNLRDNSPQISKHLNFLLPFFGMGFNYTWVHTCIILLFASESFCMHKVKIHDGGMQFM